MLTAEQNNLLTRVGAGTPGGAFVRSYWQPIAITSEFPVGSAPLPVRLCGQDLVLWRNEQGRPGLMDLHCPHRGSDLSYGRVEAGGLRCLYHGWLYDIEGRCLQQPGEPAGSEFHTKIRNRAYPLEEHGGVLFAYLGSGDPPLFPNDEAFHAPPGHMRISRVIYDCNWVQMLEGTTVDPVHTSFLHRESGHSTPPTSVNPAGGTAAALNDLYSMDGAPTIEVEETDFGLRVFTVRRMPDGQDYVRVSNYLYPNISTAATLTGSDGYGGQIFVPIDDHSTWKWTFLYRRSAPLDESLTGAATSRAATLPDGRMVQNASNRYGQDRSTFGRYYTGMGPAFNVHDAFATESQGPIQDRTREHLGYTDRALTLERKLMLRAIERAGRGEPLPNVFHRAAENDLSQHVIVSEVVPAGTDWRRRFGLKAAEPAAV